MTRAELAQAINEYVWRTTEKRIYLDVDTIARYERGSTRWPNAAYRAGFRAVLGARDDAELGFRPTPRGRADLSDPQRIVSASTLETLQTQLLDVQRIDGHEGAEAALPGAMQVVDGLWVVARDGAPSVRRDALVLAAEAAEFTGWLHRDLADTGEATRWYDRAVEYAQAAGDGQMQALVLVRKSQMAYDASDGFRVLLLARAAMDGPWRLTPRLRAEAMLQIARGELMTGQSLDVRQVVDAARAVAGDEDLSLREATCWIEAGDPARAAEIYADALAIDSIPLRDRGFFRARQAVALALAAEPALAITHAKEALGIADGTGSRRTRATVAGLVTALAPWQANDDVAALRAELTLAS